RHRAPLRRRRDARLGRARARRGGPADGAPPAAPALAQRRLPRQDRPLAGGRGPGARAGAGGGRGAGRGVNATLALQIGTVARRSIVRTMRQPAMVVPALIFPLLLLSINSGGLNAATRLPGFPTDSYLTFALGLTFIQGSMFAAMSAGTNVAMDIETGFFNRLSLTPLRRLALLVGQLSGVIVLALILATTFLVVGLTAGAGLQAGPFGMPVIVAISLLI